MVDLGLTLALEPVVVSVPLESHPYRAHDTEGALKHEIVPTLPRLLVFELQFALVSKFIIGIQSLIVRLEVLREVRVIEELRLRLGEVLGKGFTPGRLLEEGHNIT